MKFKLLISALMLAGIASTASATVISELEVNGAATNNTPASAQAISAASFTTNASATIFGTLPTVTILGKGGGGDVDFFSFVSGGGTSYFDIDNTPAGFDTVLSLFNSSGTLIAFDDDSFPADPGSASASDAFLGSINLAAGLYYIAVSEFSNLPNSLASGTGFTDLFRPDGAMGGSSISGATPGDANYFSSGTQEGTPYTLSISTAARSVVPEPAIWALFTAGGIGLSLSRRRKENKKT